MRSLCLAVLAIVFSPAIAIAQDDNNSKKNEAECSNVNDQHNWTKQEKFVWEKVSSGKIADFSAPEAGFGGGIFSTTPNKSAALLDGRWQQRTLRPCVLEQMLLNEQFAKKLTKNGLDIWEARFSERVDLSNANIVFPVRLKKCIFVSGADFSMLKSSHLLDLESSSFFSYLDSERKKISVDMDGMEIGGDLLMYWGSYDGPIDLTSAVIHGNVDFSGSTFEDPVDMTWARVQGGVLLGSGDKSSKWGPASSLDLTNAHTDSIAALTDSWPAKLSLNGLSYRSVDDASAPIDADAIEAWFRRLTGGPFSLQPYEQLANIYQTQGNIDGAIEIRFAGKQQERKLAHFGWRWFLLTAHYWLIGYGYRVWFSLGWVLLFIAVGMAISRKALRARISWGTAFVYSFDMLLPLVKLREKHYDVDLKGWPRCYFYLHKIMGFVLASFLIAGIAGLTK
jgi:hypothetical protein